jgi:hypothetical protein
VRRIFPWFAAAALVAACGTGEASKQPMVNRDTLNERQRDSILAGSRIPGASGVGKAMRVADSTSAQVQSTDTIH